MIEVEKKLNPSSESIENIKKDASFIISKNIEDVLYDFSDFSLIRNDMWLRRRNGKFDLKISKNKNWKDRYLDIYDEVENESKICEILQLNSLYDNKLIEISNLRTKREKYKLGDFNLDFDFVTSINNDFSYRIMEIELMVENEQECLLAIEKIKTFIKRYNIPEKSATAKIIQYFYEKRRDIYDML